MEIARRFPASRGFPSPSRDRRERAPDYFEAGTRGARATFTGGLFGATFIWLTPSKAQSCCQYLLSRYRRARRFAITLIRRWSGTSLAASTAFSASKYPFLSRFGQ